MSASARGTMGSAGGLGAAQSPAAELVARFADDLRALTGGSPERVGVAVSGGADSLALLLLAAAAYPGAVEAATVDHGLRAEGAAEAGQVGQVCRTLAVPHAILVPDWAEPPSGNVQALAREARYAALANWAEAHGIDRLLTAHHSEDQAETVLMRLARGAGVRGLSGIHPSAPAGACGRIAYRPLLSWRREELAAIVAAAGLEAVLDPSNGDERYDRTRVRRLLTDAPWLAPARLAATASHMAEAERALAWSARSLWDERHRRNEAGHLMLDAADLPQELQRRLLVQALGVMVSGDAVPVPALPGPKVERLLKDLQAGRPGTLAGICVRPGPPWAFQKAPPRKT